jgi:dolichol-phosphate mannosyltransferase
MVYLSVYWVIRYFDPSFGEPLHTRPALLYSVAAMLLGAQLLTVGFLAELVTAYHGQTTIGYSVRSRVGSHVHRRDDAP